MAQRYLVAVKDGDVFVFEDKKNAKSFIKDIRQKFPGVQYAVAEFGEDKFEKRAG